MTSSRLDKYTEFLRGKAQTAAQDATLFPLDASLPSHPAKYTDALLLTMAKMLQGRKRILDPFGGTGKVFLLNHWLPDAQIEAVEIEPEWAAKHPRTTLGNALALPWKDGHFDAICTSPTYGNKMADQSTGMSPGSGKEFKYRAMLGRKLHPDNSGQLHWGNTYREFHERAWTEARRVLVVGGLFVLNIKDHISAGQRVYVTDWHIDCLQTLGFCLHAHKEIKVPSMSWGLNSKARVPYESVILFALEHKP